VGSHHYEVRLKEEGAELLLIRAPVLVNQEQVHNFVQIHHEAPILIQLGDIHGSVPTKTVQTDH
jgi:hypothetical protein